MERHWWLEVAGVQASYCSFVSKLFSEALILFPCPFHIQLLQLLGGLLAAGLHVLQGLIVLPQQILYTDQLP